MRDTEHPFISAAALVIVAYLIRIGLAPLLGYRSPWLLFTAAIVIAAGRYGERPGIAAMVLSFVLGMTSFVASARLSLAETVTSLIVFLFVGGAMLVFSAHLRTSRERALRLQTELHEAHTQSALGTLASILAHELNQPLAAASNFLAASNRLIEHGRQIEPAAVVSAIGRAQEQIRRAADIIGHARELVGHGKPRREQVSLRALVGRVAEALRAGGSLKKETIRTEIQSDADTLVANSTQIEQVLSNLLRNAAQAVAGRNAELLVAAEPSDGFSIVEVRDSGPGLSEDDVKELFSGHLQSRHGGLGLGLSISRTIVEAHGGRIWAENRDAGGASFFFTVPRAG